LRLFNTNMKNLLLCVFVAAFALAAQAADSSKCPDKAASGCCAKTKVSTEAKSGCCAAKLQAKGSCPMAAKKGTKEVAARTVLHSPKMACN